MLKLPNNYTVRQSDNHNWILEHTYSSDHPMSNGGETTKVIGYFPTAKSAVDRYAKTVPFEGAGSVDEVVKRIEELIECVKEQV